MGKVYRARDTRLGRTVAIKVLPDHLAQNPDLRQRFEREARAVASLNHPHVCVLHDIGHQDGIDYMVMEYVEGESLQERLEKGPLPLEQALRYGSEIADALGRAHRSGVIHRDLKPANVMLTKTGAKLLDFGLARLATPILSGGMDLSELPTLSKPLTMEGTLLGTIPYMAPEQIKGQEGDPRTDIWAMGCLLYEMVTGKRAFMATSPADLMVTILKDEPRPMRELQPLISASLERLVERCLAKDPEERWQDARDLAAELRWIGEPRESVRSVGSRSRALGLALAGSAGAFLAAALVWLLLGHGSRGGGEGLHVAEAVRFTHEPGLFEAPTWSPDGKLVAFASNRGGNFEIYVRRVDGGQEVDVTDHAAEDVQPAFSPDGRSIAFISTRSSRTGLVPVGELGLEYRVYGGDLWITPALGGSARRLAPDANYPTWRPDGRAILYVSGPEDRRGLREISPDGSSSREVLRSEDSRWEIRNPGYSHDGLWITFGEAGGQLLRMSTRGGTPHALFSTATTSHAWADDGSLYFLRRGASGGTTIGRVTIDPRSGQVEGSEEVVAVLTGAIRDIAVAPGSHELAVGAIDGGFTLARLPLSPDGSRPAGPEDALSSGSIRNRYPAYSYDGRRLAYSSNVTGRVEVWVLDLQTLRQERLPTPEGLEIYIPAWLPDGKTLVAMGSTIGGPRGLWLVSLDGSRAEELRWAGEVSPALGSIGVSPDGRRVLVELVEGPERPLYELDLVGRSKRRLTSAPGNTYDGVWSRDGGQIAYIASKAGTLQLWTQPAEGGEARQLTFGDERMRHPSFSPDGRWIYVQPSHRNIWRVPTAGGPLEPVTRFPESGLFLEEPALSPDGRALAYARWKGGSSLWLLRLGSRESVVTATP